MNKALLCIARQKSFVLKDLASGLSLDTEYSVSLNNMDSVPLKSTPKVYFVAGQTIKLYEWHPNLPNERYRVMALSYTYGFTTKIDSKEVELLTFQWRREPDRQDSYPLGHLHVGQGLLAKPTVVRPGAFHKAHIPTERVSFAAVVRFAITELAAIPQQAT